MSCFLINMWLHQINQSSITYKIRVWLGDHCLHIRLLGNRVGASSIHVASRSKQRMAYFVMSERVACNLSLLGFTANFIEWASAYTWISAARYTLSFRSSLKFCELCNQEHCWGSSCHKLVCLRYVANGFSWIESDYWTKGCNDKPN